MDSCQHMWYVFSDRRASFHCGREPRTMTIVCYEYQCEMPLFTLHLSKLYIENSVQFKWLTYFDVFPSTLLSNALTPISTNLNLYPLCHYLFLFIPHTVYKHQIIVLLGILIEFETVGGREVFCTSSFTLNPPLTLTSYLFPTLLPHSSSLTSPTIYYPNSFNVFSTIVFNFLGSTSIQDNN